MSAWKRPGWLAFIVCVYLAGITWMVFGQTLGHRFVNFDDNLYVYENPAVAKGLSVRGIAWAFTHPIISLWTPLTTISHMLDCQLYGLAPAGHHLTNVLLHTASAILLFLILRNMTGALWRSAFVAAVFAIHPLRVESVAWVAERKDVLSGLFFMLTLGAYVWYARARSPGRYLAVAVPLAFGLMTKPMLVTTPFVLLLLDYWPLGRWKITEGEAGTARSKAAPGPGKLILEKIPLIALSVASCLMTFLYGGTPSEPPIRLALPLRIANAPVSCVTYLGQMFYPAGLALVYPLPNGGQPVWKVVLALCLLCILSAGIFLRRKEKPFLLVGWLWYLGMLAPVLGVIQMGGEAHADRYTYLPQIGIYILVTWSLAEMSVSWRHRHAILAGLGTAVIAALMVCAHVQASYWRDSESLWRRTLEVDPRNTLAHIDLGGALLDKQGRVDEAILQLQEAVKISPHFIKGRQNLGNTLLKAGRVDEAIVQYQEWVALKPDDAEAHYNLGTAFLQRGRTKDAVVHYEKAVQLRPDYVEAESNLAHVLATFPDASIRDGGKAVELAERANGLTSGGNPVVLGTLAAAYAEVGRFPEAVKTGRRAVELAAAQGNAARTARLEKELECYEANSPWRDAR